jgi:hypothetical protein
MRIRDRISDLQVTKFLRMGKNSVMRVTNADGTESNVNLTELGVLDGLTATAAELNIMDGVTATTAELNILDGVTSTAAELNILDGVTATAAELNILDGVTSTAAELNILDGVTATAVELNQAADISTRASVVNAATDVEATDNGKTFYLDSATGFACTLPAPATGLRFKFVVSTAPTSGNQTIKTDSDDNIIHGQVCSAEDAAGSVVTAAAADIINFVANLAIIGDFVELESDGTNWYVSGMCNVQDAITTVQTA